MRFYSMSVVFFFLEHNLGIFDVKKNQLIRRLLVTPTS